MKENFKFLLQTLVIPITIAVTGYIIDHNLENQKQEIEKLKLTEKILGTAFDDNNHKKAIALSELLPYLIDDEDFTLMIKSTIHNYYTSSINIAVEKGDQELFVELSNAIKLSTDSMSKIHHIVQDNAKLSKAQQAVDFENKAITFLKSGNLEESKQYFEKADKAYPGFHSSREIAKLISTKKLEKKEISNDSLAKEILKIVKIKYSWKINSKLNQDEK